VAEHYRGRFDVGEGFLDFLEVPFGYDLGIVFGTENANFGDFPFACSHAFEDKARTGRDALREIKA
jgi:hypothetical protein